MLRLRFDEALDLFEDNSLDLIYIDGYAHTGQEGGRTIYDWFTKVKLGGVFSGHDCCPDFPLTMRAVDSFISITGFDLHITEKNGGHPSWAIQKTADISLVDIPQALLRAGKKASRYAKLRHALGRKVKPILSKVSCDRQ